MQRVAFAVLSVSLPIGLAGHSGGNDACSNTTSIGESPWNPGELWYETISVDFHGDGSAECCDYYLNDYFGDFLHVHAPSGGCGKLITMKIVRNGGDCSAPSCWDPYEDVAYHGLPANCTKPDGICNSDWGITDPCDFFTFNQNWCAIKIITASTTPRPTTTIARLTPSWAADISTAKLNSNTEALV